MVSSGRLAQGTSCGENYRTGMEQERPEDAGLQWRRQSFPPTLLLLSSYSRCLFSAAWPPFPLAERKTCISCFLFSSLRPSVAVKVALRVHDLICPLFGPQQASSNSSSVPNTLRIFSVFAYCCNREVMSRLSWKPHRLPWYRAVCVCFCLCVCLSLYVCVCTCICVAECSQVSCLFVCVRVCVTGVNEDHRLNYLPKSVTLLWHLHDSL